MLTKVLLLVLAAVVTWWLTRPRIKRSSRQKKRLIKCDKCGVYYETGSDCACKNKA